MESEAPILKPVGGSDSRPGSPAETSAGDVQMIGSAEDRSGERRAGEQFERAWPTLAACYFVVERTKRRQILRRSLGEQHLGNLPAACGPSLYRVIAGRKTQGESGQGARTLGRQAIRAAQDVLCFGVRGKVEPRLSP